MAPHENDQLGDAAREAETPGAPERSETGAERADRNFTEAVGELRVAQAGVQILFAFLLSLAFLSDFPQESAAFRIVLSAALLTSAAAAVCFIAPIAFHRLHFRQGLKAGAVWITQWFSLAGLALLLTSMSLAIWLVMSHLWGTTTGTVSAVAVFVISALTWVVAPPHFLRRHFD